MAMAVRVVEGDGAGVTGAVVGGGLEAAPALCAVAVVDGEVVASADCVAGPWLQPVSVAKDNDAHTHPSTQCRDRLLIVPPSESGMSIA
jgi:hypothetical protein